MSNFVEDVRHVTEMSGGEHGVEDLPLPLVLGSSGGEEARSEEGVHTAVRMVKTSAGDYGVRAYLDGSRRFGTNSTSLSMIWCTAL